MTRLRRALVGVVVALAALIGIVVGGAAIAHASWNHERSARTISSWASRTLAGKGGPTQQAMVFERVDYPLWPALRSLFGGRPVRVEVSGFHIYSPDGDEVISAKHVSVGVRLEKLVWQELWSLLPATRDKVQLYFVDVAIEEVHVAIHRDRQGDVNLFAAFKRNHETESTRDREGGLVIDVAHSTIRDGAFSMRMPGWGAELDGISVDQRSLRYSSLPEDNRPGAPAFTYHVDWLSAPSGQIAMDGLQLPLDHVVASELRAEEPTRTTMHFSSVARSLGSSMKVHGVLEEIYGGEPSIDVHMKASHGARVLERLPSKKWMTGDVEAEAHIVGKLRAVKIAGGAKHVVAHVEGVDLKDGRGDFVLEDKKLLLEKLHAELADGTVDASARVNLTDYDFHVEVKPHDVELVKIKHGLTVEIAAGLAALVATKDPESGELENELTVHGIHIKLYRQKRDAMPDRIVVAKDKATKAATAR